MFDIIRSIIDHVFDSSYGNDQQYIYYICSVMIPLCTILVWDGICCVFRAFTRWR